jgi:hypothetical protein
MARLGRCKYRSSLGFRCAFRSIPRGEQPEKPQNQPCCSVLLFPRCSRAQHLNFSFEEDPATHMPYFRNRNPKPGEAIEYMRSSQAGGNTVGYVDVAILPNLARTGTVLLLNV